MREQELAIVLSQLTAQGSRQPAPNRPVSASYPVLTAIISSFWFFPLSRVWVSNARPVVLFCNLALLVLRQICSSLFHAGNYPHHRLYLVTSVHPGLWTSFRVCVSLLSLPHLCVFSLVLSYSCSCRIRILFFSALALFRCVYFLPDLSSFFV